VTFRHRKIPTHELYQQLMKRRIVCADRGGGIRFSPHFYTNQQKIREALHIANGY
jgi:cysteine desulfurase/selenocysteine lyase